MWEFCVCLFCNTLLCVHSIFAIIMKREIKLVALLLSYRCFVTLNVPWLFLTVTWVGLQCVIVVFPDHTNSLFNVCYYAYISMILPYSTTRQ